jgi:hypothetical protein
MISAYSEFLKSYRGPLQGEAAVFLSFIAESVRRMLSPRGRSRIALLPCPFGAERILAFRDVGLISFGIDEWVPALGLHLFVFRLHSEIRAVGSEEQIAGQALQYREGLHVVIRDLRVVFVAHQNVAGIHIRTADDDHV